MILPWIGLIVLVLMVALLYFLSKGAKAQNQSADHTLSKISEAEIKDEKVLFEELKEGKLEEKMRAIEALVELNPPGLGPVLVDAMGDKNEQIKLAAAAALKKIKDPETVPLLIEALKEPNRWVPARVAEVLVALGKPAMARVREAVAGEDERVKAYAVQILGMMEIEDSIEVFQECLKDTSVEVRRAAATVLAEKNPREAVPAFLEAIKDPDAKVRLQAVNALGNAGSQDALEVLAVAAGDENWGVAVSAVRALSKLGDKGMKTLKLIAGEQGHPCQKQAASLVGEKAKPKEVSINITYGGKGE